MFRCIIAGSRHFSDYALLVKKCDALLVNQSPSEIIVISGTARGADTLGERYAKERGFAVERFPADWDKFGKRAGFLRNSQMADVADACICFMYPNSRGTKMMSEICAKRSIPCRVIHLT